MSSVRLSESDDRQLKIISGIAQALNSASRIDEALALVLAKLAKWFGLETGWVWLLHPETAAPYLAAAQNLPPALADHPAEMEGSCYCLDTFQGDDLGGASNVNMITCSRLKFLREGTAGLRFHASVPLYAHGRKMGVLNLARQDWRSIEADELDLLYTIGDMLGIALERAQLFDRSTRLGAVEERNRLAREIHDTVAQDLAGLTLQLESADLLLDSDPEQTRRLLQGALAMSRHALEEVQRSVLDLRAAPLVGRTLTEALSELIEAAGVPITLHVTGAHQPLSARYEIGLYRMTQEAVRNIVQHAEATAAAVTLHITPDEIQLQIEDNGRGFDPETPPGSCFGLVGLNERARLLGGSMRLESGPGQGTRIEVILPFDRAAAGGN